VVVSQQITWTAVPNGSIQDGLLVSVLIAPRLFTGGPDATLEAFPDFSAPGWPVNEIDWSVSIDGRDPTPAQVVSPPAMAEVWEALFPPTTYVKGHHLVDMRFDPLRSHPTRKLLDFIESRYLDLALMHGTGFPTAVALEDIYCDLRVAHDLNGHQQWTGADDVQLETYSPNVGHHAPSHLTRTFFHLEQLHQTRQPGMDFHQALRLCRDHPALLRLLGLVVDLEVVADDGVSLPEEGFVQIRPHWTSKLGGASSDITPGARFHVKAAPSSARLVMPSLV
jgi:hypothetical protein